MSAGKYNLRIEQGASYGVRFTWQNDDKTPVDITDYVPQIQFRNEKDSDEILYDSSIGDDIDLDGPNGIINFNIPTAVTTLFTFDNCLYDLELTKDGETVRLVEGRVYLNKEVTRTP